MKKDLPKELLYVVIAIGVIGIGFMAWTQFQDEGGSAATEEDYQGPPEMMRGDPSMVEDQ
jgi:hypothetical protein